MRPVCWASDIKHQQWVEIWKSKVEKREPMTIMIDHGEKNIKRSCLITMETLLSHEEHERRSKYLRTKDQRDYLIRTAILRELLGIILNEDATSLKFLRNHNGKPFLASSAKIQFNVTHSSSLTLIAFHQNQMVGIDVERINEDLNWGPIVDRWFPTTVRSQLYTLPLEYQTKKFFELWCRFEAVLKCNGVGIGGLQESNTELVDAKETIETIEVPSGYVAKLAIKSGQTN